MKKLVFLALTLFGMQAAVAQTNQVKLDTDNKAKTVTKPTVVTNETRAQRAVEVLRVDLTLNAEQVTKLTTIKTDVYGKLAEIRKTYAGEAKKDERKAALKTLADSYKASLQTVLTAEQLATWNANVNTRMENFKKTATAQANAPKPDFDMQQSRTEVEY